VKINKCPRLCLAQEANNVVLQDAQDVQDVQDARSDESATPIRTGQVDSDYCRWILAPLAKLP